LFVRGDPTDICVVFMHGLGSTRLEGLNLLKEMPKGYSLCVFDFSGSGKSEGKSVTYGMKERHDIGKIKK
jgi:pimeloyl-ACP methyl ester carboxylesterase